MIRADIDALIDYLDAAVCSGDAFSDQEHRELLQDAMARWGRQLALYETLPPKELPKELP